MSGEAVKSVAPALISNQNRHAMGATVEPPLHSHLLSGHPLLGGQ